MNLPHGPRMSLDHEFLMVVHGSPLLLSWGPRRYAMMLPWEIHELPLQGAPKPPIRMINNGHVGVPGYIIC